MISRLCDEFGCLPSELDDEDLELLLTIMDLRSYAHAMEEYDAGGDRRERVPASMTELIEKVKGRQAKRWRRRRKRQEAAAQNGAGE